MAYGTERLYSERPGRERVTTAVTASPEFVTWDCPRKCYVLRKASLLSLVTSMEKNPLVPNGFGSELFPLLFISGKKPKNPLFTN